MTAVAAVAKWNNPTPLPTPLPLLPFEVILTQLLHLFLPLLSTIQINILIATLQSHRPHHHHRLNNTRPLSILSSFRLMVCTVILFSFSLFNSFFYYCCYLYFLTIINIDIVIIMTFIIQYNSCRFVTFFYITNWLNLQEEVDSSFDTYHDFFMTDLIEPKPYLLSGFAIGFDHIKCFLRHTCYIRLNIGTGKIEEEEGWWFLQTSISSILFF